MIIHLLTLIVYIMIYTLSRGSKKLDHFQTTFFLIILFFLRLKTGGPLF